VIPVVDAGEGAKSNHGIPSSLAIDFGPPSNDEINVRYWETY